MSSSVLRGLRRSSRFVAVIIVGVLALAQVAGLSPSVGAADPVTVQSAITHSEAKIGPTDAKKSITLAVSLAPNVNQQQMEDFVKGLSDPTSPNFHKYLTPQEYTATFLDPAVRVQVVHFLKSKGLTVKDSSVGSIINATGTAAQIEAAFAVSLSDYTGANGQVFYANDKTPALPTALAPHITAVLGLDTRVAAYSHAIQATNPTPHATPNTATGCAGLVNVVNTQGGFAPNQFATAFDFDTLYSAGYKGEGQTLALFELADWSMSDSNTYKTCLGSTTPVSRNLVGTGTPITADQAEVNLDIDIMLGMLPKMAHLNVYVAANTDADAMAEYQQIATDNTAKVVSTSWGLCEVFHNAAFLNAENTIFMQMATQGQQLFAASGDDGSADCARDGNFTLQVDDPASQPFVTGVGGTTVSINSVTNAYVSETVWNHNGGGGGGLSGFWSKPAYQTGPGTTNTFSNGKREVPDMSAPADPNTGYPIFNAGMWAKFGGTSAAAPFSASGFALMNQAFVARGGSRLAFANPTLYTLLTNTPSVFHDVTAGNNCAQPSGPCVTAGSVYPATATYDLATGVGTPKFGAIANVLIPVAGLQFYPLAKPVRLLDTRAGSTAFVTPNKALAAGQTLSLPGQFSYQGVAIPATAQAIVGNATVANGGNGTPAGFATIYPSGVPLPLTSNLNFVPGTVRPNAFTVALGADTKFDLYSSSGGDFVVDISGYYAPVGAGGLYFHPLPAPVRELDTRSGATAFVHPDATMTAGQTLNLPGSFAFNGIAIPASAKALVGNATVANGGNGTPAGFATLFPDDVPLPLASNLNFVPGTVAPNAFTVGVGGGGGYKLYSSSGGDFVVDITGYLDTTAAGGLLFTPLAAPVRELDTRSGATAFVHPNATLTAGQTLTLPGAFTFAGITVPVAAQALVGNATVANDGNATPAGYATLYPDGVPLPLASNLNFVPGQVAPNAVVVVVGSDGKYDLYSSSGGDFVIDITGYFAAPGAAGAPATAPAAKPTG